LKKQIPFRYEETLEEDFKILFKLQWGEKKNQALIDAVQIAAAITKKELKENDSNWKLRDRLNKRFNLSLRG